jgi:hypothetical protein
MESQAEVQERVGQMNVVLRALSLEPSVEASVEASVEKMTQQ